jgi:hypothetical protein
MPESETHERLSVGCSAFLECFERGPRLAFFCTFRLPCSGWGTERSCYLHYLIQMMTCMPGLLPVPNLMHCSPRNTLYLSDFLRCYHRCPQRVARRITLLGLKAHSERKSLQAQEHQIILLCSWPPCCHSVLALDNKTRQQECSDDAFLSPLTSRVEALEGEKGEDDLDGEGPPVHKVSVEEIRVLQAREPLEFEDV